MRISDLPGLGPASEKMLGTLDIMTAADLAKRGPVEVYLQLEETLGKTQSLNLLYAMVGALENKHWTQIAREEKTRLLTELEGAREYRRLIET